MPGRAGLFLRVRRGRGSMLYLLRLGELAGKGAPTHPGRGTLRWTVIINVTRPGLL